MIDYLTTRQFYRRLIEMYTTVAQPDVSAPSRIVPRTLSLTNAART